MKKIVLSLGGSILVPTLENNRINEYCETLTKLSESYQIYVVIGGGGEARKFINAARSLKINEAASDELGIMITRINASLLMWALKDAAYPVVAKNYIEAMSYGASGRIVLMGGVIPGQTTDAVAAVLAEYLNADLLLNITSVNGIYTKDPKTDSHASKFDHMTPDELIDIVSGGKMSAGANNIIDLVAAKMLQRNTIPMLVIDGSNPKNLVDALIGGKFDGTVVSKSSKFTLPL